MKSNAIFSKYSAKKWNTVTVPKNEIQCQKMEYSVSVKKWNTVTVPKNGIQ